MITCETCQSTDFYRKDGVTYCQVCQTESQEHGAETVVDEESMGMFSAGTASTLRKM